MNKIFLKLKRILRSIINFKYHFPKKKQEIFICYTYIYIQFTGKEVILFTIAGFVLSQERQTKNPRV